MVVLNRVTLQSTGRYRCEVSGEAPSFQTVSGHEDMIVVGKYASQLTNNNNRKSNKNSHILHIAHHVTHIHMYVQVLTQMYEPTHNFLEKYKKNNRK